MLSVLDRTEYDHATTLKSRTVDFRPAVVMCHDPPAEVRGACGWDDR